MNHKMIEENKKEIAREIHDGPLQTGLYISRRLKQLNDSKQNTVRNEEITEIQELINNLNDELRTICFDLRTSILKNKGLIDSISVLMEEIMKKESIVIFFDVEGFSNSLKLEEKIEVTIFRIIQEGIRNIVRHSGSKKVEIKLRQKTKYIEIELKDFGQGFDITILEKYFLEHNHFGLIGMRERVQNLGGEFIIMSHPREGTVLQVILPNQK
ncbi:histidine kinase [Syntrophobotulus glycolicus DSM 8271]|uniref:histidine kinase n=1 Tax=Syntrophobotulus glycolicus (strain DSM 8271 / FlGlyR) TaxID=645991 RepID=F0T0N5_SYNGF|nr:sensor histidine kinase [Syntrophobotulus glycolicus]ADY55100.1 histidine kinase [Syntrophobotulus glycolicus DSM 8271]